MADLRMGSRRGIAVVALLAAAILPIGCAKSAGNRNAVDDRIRFYSDKLSANPRLYPVHAQLAAAYLDKTRKSHDPRYLELARKALRKSLEIQPSFLAFKTFAAVSNFGHRFQEGLRWASLAAEANPSDTSVTALLVEAEMGLGLYQEASRRLQTDGPLPHDFYLAVSLGHWLASQGRHDRAAEAFARAADAASDARNAELLVWATVQAAGALIDGRLLNRAAEHLDAAARINPRDVQLRLHHAELLEARARPAEALEAYEGVLAETDDPEIHARAMVVAGRIERRSAETRHFHAAERGYQRAIDAGEVYTLGALARLYVATDRSLDQAEVLAKRNLEFKRDHQAQETLQRVRRKLAAGPG